MPELPRGSHTIRSHGRRVARIHLRDWLILLLLAFLDGGLNVIEPFHRFVGSGTLEDLKFPLKHNTVPFWAVPLIAVFLPFTVILVRYFIRKDVYDFHQATLGLLFSVLITAVMTDSIKDAVGRPRPDFFWRCFPSGKPVFDRVYGGVMCNGTQSIIKEGYKSFPSGHTSWTFAGLVFLPLYIAGKVQAFDKSGHVANLCLIFSPILVACLVGVSRIDDYWHHWQDVFAGALLGSVVAVLCYLQFFPPPYDDDGWEPHAYFQTLAESTNIDIQPSNLGRMSLSVQPVVADIQSEHVIEVSTLSSQGNLQDSAGSSSDGPQLMERQ